MLKRSDSAYERALALDPNLIVSAVQLIGSRTERGEVGNAYAEASALVRSRPDSAQAHFALGYVQRYAGLLDQSAHECQTALALDRGNYLFRSCAIAFMELDQPQKAMEFVHLDAGSEWAARTAAEILLREGKLAEARQSIQRTSANPLMGRDLLQTCLDRSSSSALDGIAQKSVAAVLAGADPEDRYHIGSLLVYCGRNDAAVRLLKSAVAQNYCAYTALQTDPLLAKLRGTTDFNKLLSAAKECQNRFLAQRERSKGQKIWFGAIAGSEQA
jgi:hypothetical protein